MKTQQPQECEEFINKFGVLQTADGNHAVSINLFDLKKMYDWFKQEITKAEAKGAEIAMKACLHYATGHCNYCETELKKI